MLIKQRFCFESNLLFIFDLTLFYIKDTVRIWRLILFIRTVNIWGEKHIISNLITYVFLNISKPKKSYNNSTKYLKKKVNVPVGFCGKLFFNKKYTGVPEWFIRF